MKTQGISELQFAFNNGLSRKSVMEITGGINAYSGLKYLC